METIENKNEKRNFCCGPKRWVGWIFFGIIAFTAFAFLFGAVVMWLWNWLMPVIFHLGMITYWQAVGIAVLARLLFGSLHHGGHHGRGNHGHGPWKHGRWGHHGNRCGNNSNVEKWNYYEQYWNEEGEKSFNDYVQKKSENPVKE